ncbi:MAG: hypothetical protein ACW98F_07465 [Candidatus Hodarchaeales archaeon]|jgi:uncharacterized protein with PIN domain
MIFGKGKDECWVCRRKVSGDGIFLTATNLQEAFSGIFKNFDVTEEFKNLCVCEVCAGIVKILASEPIQARMALSKARIDIKDKISVGREKIGSVLKRK